MLPIRLLTTHIRAKRVEYAVYSALVLLVINIIPSPWCTIVYCPVSADATNTPSLDWYETPITRRANFAADLPDVIVEDGRPYVKALVYRTTLLFVSVHHVEWSESALTELLAEQATAAAPPATLLQ